MARVILEVKRRAWRDLEKFARRQGWDAAEFVRRAIGTQRYLIEQEESGFTVKLIHNDGVLLPLELQIGARPLNYVRARQVDEEDTDRDVYEAAAELGIDLDENPRDEET